MLYLITDDTGRSPRELAHIVEEAVRGGVDAVQFREKKLAGRLLTQAYKAVAEICRSESVPLHLNSDLASRLDCDITSEGIHYNSRTLPLHPGAIAPLSGYSAHDAEDALSAFERGVAFCTVSPIYPTPSKTGVLDAIGCDGFARVREEVGPGRKLLALGGIEADNAAACMAAGADGIAVIRAIMAAPDPRQAARKLRAVMERALEKQRAG